MKQKYIGFLLLFLFISALHTQSHAIVEWDTYKTLALDSQPLDIAISKNGDTIFVLTKSGKILIYSANGKLQDIIDVGDQFDQIEAGPSEEWLFLSSRKDKSVEILHVEFIQTIDTSEAPFQGPANAPVVIAVFSDFQ